MSDTYLQDFGTRRSIHRARPKVDPMAASGRWDDLFLRASKPILRKGCKRKSMRRDLKITLTPGGKVYTGVKPTGKLTAAIGMTSDSSAIKYKLDSPSYPARHRELSHERAPWRDRKDEGFVVGVRNVYDVLRGMVHKLRFRDPKLNARTEHLFRVAWANRHKLAKLATLPAKPKVVKLSVKPIAVAPKPKSKPRKVAKAVYEEYEQIKSLLHKMDKTYQLAHESWDKVAKADRQELLRRQRVLLSIIEAGK